MSSRVDGKVESVIDNDLYDDLGVHGWWDQDGPQHGLHQMNPMRTGYFHDRLQAEGVGVQVQPDKQQPMIVEIGCGGGIVSEAMASLGYRVHGIDISAGSISVAQAHSASTFNKEQMQNLTYTVGNAYNLPLESQYADVIIMSDVLEHLDDLPKALAEVKRVLKPGGVFLFDTFNRTFLSWFFGIFGAQLLLGIVPNHCHDWDLFIKPNELDILLENNDIRIQHLSGFDVWFNPFYLLWSKFTGRNRLPMHFSLVNSLSVQYIGQAVKLKENLVPLSKDPSETKASREAFEKIQPKRITIEDSPFLPRNTPIFAGSIVATAVAFIYYSKKIRRT
jgi:2-polyprenyl-6-hydroxyphenyl methylase / 3-demethylubiquinone-9 3-methyltransferase